MQINPYKLTWILIGVFLLALFAGGIYYLASHLPERSLQSQAPGYTKTPMPGKVTKIAPPASSPNIQTSPNITAPAHDSSLDSAGKPVSSSVLKAPEGPALPPSEQDILHILLESQKITPSQIFVKTASPVILQVESKDGDYVFKIEKIGIAEKIKKGTFQVISFRAPAKPISLRYYFENFQTGALQGEGKLVVE